MCFDAPDPSRGTCGGGECVRVTTKGTVFGSPRELLPIPGLQTSQAPFREPRCWSGYSPLPGHAGLGRAKARGSAWSWQGLSLRIQEGSISLRRPHSGQFGNQCISATLVMCIPSRNCRAQQTAPVENRVEKELVSLEVLDQSFCFNAAGLQSQHLKWVPN